MSDNQIKQILERLEALEKRMFQLEIKLLGGSLGLVAIIEGAREIIHLIRG